MIAIELQASAETKKLLESEQEKLALALKKEKINVSEIKVNTIVEAKKDA